MDKTETIQLTYNDCQVIIQGDDFSKLIEIREKLLSTTTKPIQERIKHK